MLNRITLTAREAARHVGAGLLGPVSAPHDRDVDHILDGEGCVACEAMEKAEVHYFFWLLAENKSDPAVIQDFAERSGFCRRHACYLADRAEGPGLAHLYEFTCAHALALAEAPQARHRVRFAQVNGCPACLVLREVEQGVFDVLHRALGRTNLRERYPVRRPLCFLHTQRFLACAPRGAVRSVIEVVDQWLADASGQSQRPSARGLGIERAATALVGRRVLTAGTAPPPGLPIAGDPDPMQSLGEVVYAHHGCPVCYEILRVCAERLAWLADLRANVAVREIEDVLPLCDAHLWIALCALPDWLRAVTLARAVRTAREQLARALCPESVQARSSPLRWLRALPSAARFEQLTIAREIAAKPLYCPMCVRAEAAEKRTVDLVLTLTEHPSFRRKYEEGTGLCMRHLAVALKHGGSPEALRFLLSAQHAKLQLLQWELQEASRKDIWVSRFEHQGSEGQAWGRALMMFAGVVSFDLSTAQGQRQQPNTVDPEGAAS